VQCTETEPEEWFQQFSGICLSILASGGPFKKRNELLINKRIQHDGEGKNNTKIPFMKVFIIAAWKISNKETI